MTRKDRLTLLKIISEGVLIVIIISAMWLSLMGLRGFEYRTPPNAPFLQADKGEIIRLTPSAMAKATYEYNKKMEARAK